MQNPKISEEAFKDIIRNSGSFLEAAKKLGMAYTYVKIRADVLKVSPGLPSRVTRGNRPYTADQIRETYLSNAEPIYSTQLRDMLIRTGIKEAKCELCKNTEWLDLPIPLELHHINCNHHDNTESNLMILCPTCHAYITRKNSINRALIKAEEKRKLKAQYEEKLKNGFPADEIHGVKFNVTAEELLNLFKELRAYIKVAEYFGVSDNSIRKRCKRLGIFEAVQAIVNENRRDVAARNRGQMTAEKREKIGATLRAQRSGIISQHAKPIEQLDKDTGELLAVYPSIKLGAMAVNASIKHLAGCLHGRCKSCKGFKWRFHPSTADAS